MTLWTAELVVEDLPNDHIGYQAFGSLGSLTPDSFVFAGNTIRVGEFAIRSGVSCALELVAFSTFEGGWDNAEARWVLHIDSHTFDFADAGSWSGARVSWCNVTADDLGWAAGATVDVKITRSAGEPIAPPDAHPVIWQADITPGSDRGQEGWSSLDGDTSDPYGRLTGPARFGYKGSTYEFSQIYTQSGNTYLQLKSGSGDDLAGSDSKLSFHVGSRTLALSSSSAFGTSGGVLLLGTAITWPDAVIVGLSTSEPGAPGDLSATALSNTEITVVTLGWSEPEKIGGSAITGYEYRRSNDGGANWGAWTAIANSGSLTSYLVTGLSADTTYTFQMRAANDSGSGLHSPAAEQQAGTGTLRPPGPPGNFAASGGDGSAALSWAAPRRRRQPSRDEVPVPLRHRRPAPGRRVARRPRQQYRR